MDHFYYIHMHVYTNAFIFICVYVFLNFQIYLWNLQLIFGWNEILCGLFSNEGDWAYDI